MAVILRAVYLQEPVRYDEAWTYVHYASQSLVTSLGDYSEPNNHIFHTLLVWISTRLLGNTLVALRLPAFVAGVFLVPATWMATRRLAGMGAGLLAAAIVSGMPVLVLYSTNARGYSLICLAFVLLILVGSIAHEQQSSPAWLVFSLILAIGMYTVPIMLYPAGAVICWLMARTIRDPARRAGTLIALAKAIALGVLLTAAFYGPVLVRSGIAPLIRNPFVTPLTFRELVQGAPAFSASLKAFFFGDVSLPWTLLLVVGALVAIVRRSPLGVFAVVTTSWCVMLALAMHRWPFPRVWLFGVVLLAMTSGDGLAWIASIIWRAPRQLAIAAAAASVLLATTLALSTWKSGSVSRSEESGTLRDAAAIARIILPEVTPTTYVVLAPPSGPPLEYYLYAGDGTTLADFKVRGATRIWIVVNDHLGQTLESVIGRRPDIDWNSFDPPQLRRRFAEASVYETNVHVH